MQAAEKIFEGKFDDVVDSELPLEVNTRDALDGNKALRMVVSIYATTTVRLLTPSDTGGRR